MVRYMSSGEQPVSQRTRLAKFWFWFPSLVLVLMASVLYNRVPDRDRQGRRTKPSYLVSGSFTSSALYVIRYERETRSLQVVQSVPGHGPHQYLYIHRPSQRLYVTSWQAPARLSAWSILVDQPGNPPRLSLINQASITAISSYITSKYDLLFSVGGPTGEIHQLDPETGAIGEKVQELLFVAPDALENEDKSRKALRNGSHAIEVSSLDQVFVPHLGHNSIWMYNFDLQNKAVDFFAEFKSVQGSDDGPRHLVISEDGERAYVVTEHTSRVDLYQVKSLGLVHQASSSIIDDPQEHLKFRGDTVRILPRSLTSLNHEYIFATTRGADPAQPGILAIFEYNSATQTFKNLLRWETPTSGGKANAIEFNPRKIEDRNIIELVLTDDQLGSVSILQCDLDKLKVQVISSCLIDQIGIGASHAVWI